MSQEKLVPSFLEASVIRTVESIIRKQNEDAKLINLYLWGSRYALESKSKFFFATPKLMIFGSFLVSMARMIQELRIGILWQLSQTMSSQSLRRLLRPLQRQMIRSTLIWSKNMK